MGAAIVLYLLVGARVLVILLTYTHERWFVVWHEQIKVALEVSTVGSLLWWLHSEPPGFIAQHTSFSAIALRGYSLALEQVRVPGGVG